MKPLVASCGALLAATVLTGLFLFATAPFPAPVDALSRDPGPLVRRLGKPDVSVHGSDFTWIAPGIVFSWTLRVVHVPTGAGYAPAPFAERTLWIGDPRGRGFRIFSNGAATL